MQRRLLLRAATVPASLALVAAAVLPSQAAELAFTDSDASGIKADIVRARVVHGTHNVRVRVRFDDLPRSGVTYTQGLSLFIDADRANRGPEYHFTTGLNSGTDWAFTRVGTWNDDGPRVKSCEHSVKLDWKADVAVLRFARSCIGSPRSIRVALRAVETEGGTTRSDWAPKYRTFTSPIASD